MARRRSPSSIELPGPGDQLVAGHVASSPAIIASRSARARSVHGPGRPSPIGSPSNAGHRQDPGHARRQERLVGRREVGPAEPALDRPKPDARAPRRAATSGSSRAGSRSRATGVASSTTSSAARPDEEDVGGRALGQVAVGRQEERVVRAGPARLEPGVDVVGARRGLERRERVGRVAPDGRGDESQAALEVAGRRGDDRPGLDRDRGRDGLVGRQQTATAERAARDGDPDRGVAGRPVEPVRHEQVGDPDRQHLVEVVREGDVEAGGGASAGGRCARPARSGGRRGRGASRRCRRRAGTRDRRPRGAGRPRAGGGRRPRRGRAWPGAASPGPDVDPLTRPPRRRWRRAARSPWRRSPPIRRPGRSSR